MTKRWRVASVKNALRLPLGKRWKHRRILFNGCTKVFWRNAEKMPWNIDPWPYACWHYSPMNITSRCTNCFGHGWRKRSNHQWVSIVLVRWTIIVWNPLRSQWKEKPMRTSPMLTTIQWSQMRTIEHWSNVCLGCGRNVSKWNDNTYNRHLNCSASSFCVPIGKSNWSSFNRSIEFSRTVPGSRLLTFCLCLSRSLI